MHCTCTVPVNRADAEASERGVWHVVVLATAKDGETKLLTKAADFTVAQPARAGDRWGCARVGGAGEDRW